jgi:hypothetical protein
MSLRLRQLQLRVQTGEGLYGARIEFDDGLVILRADNSMGKSTCVQAIIYALGLERMLGPSSDVPLPHVMTRYVEDGVRELTVLESEVLLEIANSRGEALTIKRGVVGERDTRLISTWEGGKLSNPDDRFTQLDYFVRDPGAATHPAGFHTRLARFLGWELPVVTRFSGSDCPLYLEAIFPLFVVEQKHGWAGIQANLPTFLGIREVAKRALEFVLNLDAAGLAEQRQRLEQEESQLRSNWKTATSALGMLLRLVSGRVIGIPEHPTTQWPPAVLPQFEVFRAGQWLDVRVAQGADREELDILEADPVPTVGATAEGLSQRLSEARQILSVRETLAAALLDENETEKVQLRALENRLVALRDDLQRNRDALRLRSFGSVAEWSSSDHLCPTCHQRVTDALLPQGTAENAMSLEDNITFISNQIRTFERLRENTAQLISRKDAELDSLRAEISSLRTQIRAIRQSLLSPESAPSIESVRQRIELERGLRLVSQALEDFDAQMDALGELAGEWRRLQERKQALPTAGLSPLDQEKLRRFEQLLRQQLREFGFSSISPDSVDISPESYRPTREGFNLGFDLSASDNIRIIWAYLEGLLELSSVYDLRHPGLLVLDEPRQQEAAQLSFEQLLRRASTCRQRGQQVVFVTSEPLEELNRMTEQLRPTIINFEGRVIARFR